jgi:hypothetical protein
MTALYRMSDALLPAAAINELPKRRAASKVDWGHPGDEMLDDDAIDERDPCYDSADELFEAAFGSCVRNTKYDWATVAQLSAEDDCAMDEIEDAMREEWIAKADLEQAEVDAEGEAFFAQTD